jgi:predicted secreted protein with PEFG-CTERM motif
MITSISLFGLSEGFAQEMDCKTESRLYDIRVDSEGYFSPGVGIDKNLTITGRVLDEDCTVISNAKIVAELLRSTNTFSKTVNSSNDGSFEIILDTAGNVGHHEEYQLYITTIKEDEVVRKLIQEVRFYDIHRFPITEEGKTATVEISPNQGSQINSFAFDKNSKKISLEVEHFDNEAGQFLVAIPSNLISGEITVIKDGYPVFTLTQENLHDNDYGPEMDPENGDIRHSYSLRGKIIENYTQISYNFIPKKTSEIEIIGTTAIPEFQAVSIVILAVSIFPIILARNKLILR